MSKMYQEGDVADLHLHSTFSDGAYTPQMLVERALQTELSCIALTDHDTLEGCELTQKLCEEAHIGFIAGVELTSYALGEEVHILGFAMDIHNAGFLEKMKKFQTARQERLVKMVSLLNQAGVGLKLEEVQALAHCSAPGRMHVARALVQGKYCRDRDEVFSHYIGERQVAWVPKVNFTIKEAVELLHSAGGVALVAHPGVQKDMTAITGHALQMGIDGFECYHPRHSNATTKRLLELCQRHRLLVSGGSDCHGVEEKACMGSIRLPIAQVERLKEWVYSKNLKKD